MSRYTKKFFPDGSTATFIDGELVEGTLPTRGESGPYVMPDLDAVYGGAFTSPIDGSVISSRSQLREHNIRHDVIQSGDKRGEARRDAVKQRMRYNPEARTQNDFAWGKCESGDRHYD